MLRTAGSSPSIPAPPEAVPGVFAVWTAADISDVPPIDFREGWIEKLEPYRQPVLAADRARYVGDPIAAVFADDPYVAEDAADLVLVDIEELPVLLDARAEPGKFLRRAQHRSGRRPPGLRRSRCGVSRGACGRGVGAVGRAPFRRATRDARRDRPLRRRQGCPRIAWCRQDTARQPQSACAHARVALHRRSPCTNPMSAAASGSAAKSIRRTCWSASQRCGSAGR